MEIARALAFDARLIIMDEPTAPLSGAETSRLFRTIAGLRALRREHGLHHSPAAGDLRSGGSGDRAARRPSTSEPVPHRRSPRKNLVRDMIGELRLLGARGQQPRGRREILRVEGFTKPANFEDISFR